MFIHSGWFCDYWYSCGGTDCSDAYSQSIIPTMVPEEEITRVNGQFGIIQSLIFIVSPGIGAFMVATTLPIHWVFYLM